MTAACRTSPPGWLRRPTDWLAGSLVALLAVALRLPTLNDRLASYDEAVYLVQAARLQTAERFALAYVYRTETKPQIGLLPYLAAQLADPAHPVWWLRVFGALAVAAGCVALLGISRQVVGSAWPGLAAGAAWSAYLVAGPQPGTPFALPGFSDDYVAPLLEYFQAPLVLVSVWAVLRAARLETPGRAPHILALIAGVAWGGAMLIRPTVVLLGPALAAALLWQFGSGPRRWLRARFTLVAVAAGGGLAAAVALLVPYLLRPETLAEVRFNLVDLSLQYVQGPPLVVRLVVLLGALPPPLLLLFGSLAPALLLRRATGTDGTSRVAAVRLLYLLGIAAFASVLPGLGFSHYLIAVVPVLAIAAACALALLVSGLPARRRWLASRVVLPTLVWGVYAALYAAPFASYLTTFGAGPDRYLAEARARYDLDGLVSYVQTNTPADGRLWVYYNAPEVYLLAGRTAGSRVVDNAYLARFPSETWFGRAAEDLDREQPHLVVEIDNPLWPWPAALRLGDIPPVAARVQADYMCDAQRIRGATVCRRLAAADRELS